MSGLRVVALNNFTTKTREGLGCFKCHLSHCNLFRNLMSVPLMHPQLRCCYRRLFSGHSLPLYSLLHDQLSTAQVFLLSELCVLCHLNRRPEKVQSRNRVCLNRQVRSFQLKFLFCGIRSPPVNSRREPSSSS